MVAQTGSLHTAACKDQQENKARRIAPPQVTAWQKGMVGHPDWPSAFVMVAGEVMNVNKKRQAEFWAP